MIVKESRTWSNLIFFFTFICQYGTMLAMLAKMKTIHENWKTLLEKLLSKN